jgi:hypothetical protein
LASKSFSLLPALLLGESPKALLKILDISLLLSGPSTASIGLRDIKFVDLYAMLQDYAKQMANTVLPERYIWRHICNLISDPDPTHAVVMAQSWRCFTDSLSRFIGRFSYTGITSEVNLIRRTYRNDF